MNTDEVRARFEKWLREAGKHELDLMRNKADVDGYASYPTQYLWQGYQQATKDNEGIVNYLNSEIAHRGAVNQTNVTKYEAEIERLKEALTKAKWLAGNRNDDDNTMDTALCNVFSVTDEALKEANHGQ